MVDGYIYAGIPLETLVTDSQYMDKDQDFTFSKDFPVESMQARSGSDALHRCQALTGLSPVFLDETEPPNGMLSM